MELFRVEPPNRFANGAGLKREYLFHFSGTYCIVESKYISVNFDSKQYPNNIELLMLTDVQFGHLMCQEARFIEFRDWVLSKPNRFVLFGGDMVDAAHAFSVGS